MSKDAIIEKIKKLLRMKRGGTPGEIENALAAAAKLAREHCIDLSQVNPDEEASAEKLTHLQDLLKTRLPPEAKLAGGIVTRFFNVSVIVQRYGVLERGRFQKRWLVNLIGTEWDCRIAKYVFAFLQRMFRATWANRENRRLRNREAFLHGVYIGLACRLEAEASKEVTSKYAGLAIERNVALREMYIARKFPNLEKQNFKLDNSAKAATWAGAQAGQKIQIRTGLNRAEAAARPALPAPQSQPSLI